MIRSGGLQPNYDNLLEQCTEVCKSVTAGDELDKVSKTETSPRCHLVGYKIK